MRDALTGVLSYLTFGVDYKVINKTIELLPTVTPIVDNKIRIERKTSTTEKIVTYIDASVLKAQELDLVQLQQLHILEELNDYIVENSMTVDLSGLWDAQGKRITNLGTPVDPNDAITKAYMETVGNGFVVLCTSLTNQAETYRDEALVSSQSASSSSTTAQSWAIGDIVARPEGSSKHWAKLAEDLTKANLFLRKDGSTSMDNEYVPIQPLDVSTKEYVDEKIVVVEEGVTEALSNGESIGTIKPWLVTTIPEGWLDVSTGALVGRETYSGLWEWVQANAPLISEVAWQAQAVSQSSVGFFSTGDGSTTFRLPRIVDFIRGADGTRLPGTYQVDNFQGHFHSTQGPMFSPTAGTGVSVAGGTGHYQFQGTIGPITDGINGTPRTGVETRPKSISMLYCIKAFGSATNQGVLDVTALANEVAGKQKTIKYIQIQDEKTSGTAGGTFTSGAWRTRDLNTIKHDDTAQVIVSSNQITLPAGTYEFTITSPCNAVSGTRTRLQNITSGTTIGVSKTMYSTLVFNNVCEIRGKFTLSGSTVLEVQHWGTTTVASTGFGFQSTISGVNEIYTTAMFRKAE